MINYSTLSLQAFDEQGHTIEEHGKRRVDMLSEINSAAFMVGVAALNYINDNWKVKSAHDTFWNIGFSSIAMFEYGKSLLDANDDYLMVDGATEIYKTVCKNISDMCDAVCEKRKYVASITDGGILGPLENKASIWLNDTLSANYRAKGHKALEDRNNLDDRFNKKKEALRIQKLKANPEELNKCLSRLSAEQKLLISKISELNEELNNLYEQKKNQELTQTANKFKLFGEAARIKKEATAKIQLLSSDIAKYEEEKDQTCKKLANVNAEIQSLSN